MQTYQGKNLFILEFGDVAFSIAERGKYWLDTMDEKKPKTRRKNLHFLRPVFSQISF